MRFYICPKNAESMHSSSSRLQKELWCDDRCCRNRKIVLFSHTLLFFLSLPFLFPVVFSSGEPELSIPTIGTDQLIYACANNEVVAFRGNGSLAWSASMNQTCQTNVAPVIDYNGKVYAAADQTVIVVTPPSSASKRPSAADFFRMVPPSSLKSIGNFSSVIGLAVTSWSSVLYINTGTGVHAFMLDGTPLWSTLVQFNGSVMKSPKSMGVCADNVTDCAFFPSLAVDQCDGSIYVARSDGWLYSYATWQPFLRWRYALSLGVPSLIKVICGNNGRVYVTLLQYNTVYAISADLGTLVWEVKVGPLGETSSTVLVDSSGFVSVGSIDGFLYVISPDGRMQKYLANDVLSPVSIQTSPILDCSNDAIYIAQTKIASKTLEQFNGTETISFTESWGMNIWLLVPSTGRVLWGTEYPDLFPTTILLNDINSYRISSDWIIALTASANLSRKSMCKTEEELHKFTCTQFLFNATKQRTGGSSQQIISFAISIMVIFLFLLIVSTVLYYYWRKKQTIHRHRLCQLLKQEKLRDRKGSLLRRQKSYERKIEYLQATLELEPQSIRIAEELRSALEGLHFVKRSLALFSSSSDNDDISKHQDWMQRPSIPLVEFTSSSTQARSPFSSFLSRVDSILEKVLGTVKEGDFSEELRMLSSYNDEFVVGYDQEVQIPPAIMSNNESSRSRSNQKSLGKNVSSLSPPTGKYKNPLYNQSRSVTPSPTLKRTVTFSPVDEIFEESKEDNRRNEESQSQNQKLTRGPDQKTVTFSPVNKVFEESERSSSTDYTCTSSSSEQSRSPSPMYKKSVTFSPVNEIFGGSSEGSSNGSSSDEKS